MKAIRTALLSAAALVVFWPAVAGAQIKQPGAHPDYVAELEPHLLLQWAEGPDWNDDVGFGLGFRASIPFFHNGPIKKINNNMGITFGLDTTFFSGCYNHYYWGWGGWHGNWNYYWANTDCSGSDWTFPVAMQWNFWLTDVVSVFGEPGFAISYETGSIEAPPQVCGNPAGCDDSVHDIEIEPVFWAGGRFLVGDSIAIVARLGVPTISVGVSFLL